MHIAVQYTQHQNEEGDKVDQKGKGYQGQGGQGLSFSVVQIPT